MSKVLGLRVPEELADWAKSYAESRGVTVQALLEEALLSFKEDSESGVPEIRKLARRQSSVRDQVLGALQGVGDCPERPGELGHIWKSPRECQFRSCRYCGAHGREPALGHDPKANGKNEGGGFLPQATAERAELFSRLKAPMQNGTGKSPSGSA